MNVQQVVKAINTLAAMPKTKTIIEPAVYESKWFFQALCKGLGSKNFVGTDESSDFDCFSTKNYFFAKHKNRSGLKYYVYVDLIEGKCGLSWENRPHLELRCALVSVELPNCLHELPPFARKYEKLPIFFH